MKKPTPQLSLISLCILNIYSLSAYAENNTITLDEITVVGEKFERNQSTTGSSTSVVTTDQLKREANLLSATQLLKRDVNISDTGLGNDLPTVRGVDGSGPAVGAVAFFAGSRPRLNMQIDGRTSSYNELAFGTKSLWDMKQVEIYRGAQSYAQGRNAIAGAVVMTSNDPTQEWEGAAKLNMGNHRLAQTAALISGPVVKDELAFRLSVDHQQRETAVDLPHYDPVGNPRWFKATNTRAKLLWTPSALPDLYSRLTFNHLNARAPQSETELQPNSPRYTPERPVFQTRSASTIWDIGYQLSDRWKWENKLVYTHFIHDRKTTSPFNTALPPNRRGVPARVDGNEFQIEPIVKYESEKYRGLFGLFYFNAKQDESVTMLNGRIARTPITTNFNDKTKTKAAFGEITFTPDIPFELTLSARYEQEHHQRKGKSAMFSINRDKKYYVFLPKADIAWKINDNQRLGFKVGKGYNPGGAGVTFGVPYTSYEYDAEYVWNYELYHRWISTDKRLRINSNLFYNDYKDMQLPFTLGPNSIVIRNADKVVTYGAEINTEWQATEKLALNAGIGMLKTDIKRYPNSGIEGNKLARAPSFSGKLGANYRLLDHLEIGTNYSYNSSYYSTADNLANGKVGHYDQLDVYLAYDFKYARITLYADNVLNSRKDILLVPRSGDITRQPERQIGLSTELRF
ncbi:MAG: TonB-dependent receptor [Haemophilus parainfluenzae]|jgi:iron complex outermembrane receptor protein|uniref:TonB-dependent siderophore receptor n=1 Tax=Haemophilus parainfluenzae HK2019 TaxID=1095746 RepID=A0ABP2NZM8_HAEPA|nr:MULTISPECIES: TonB-dependent receptor [Haemophilus]EIF39381.1 TonB-dependent siderophore receptor [Haemophilus parainfluenzae HK262]EIJ31723.1 TonB-dependent siderophore receptor [Haemophilus parainfluenzae HK2019]MDU5804564.1 TonB-dependent receptor [Haemophilus parainfluenzae]MDU5822428.1 TonB-dependent receptor [Haemophilus parainfluenzae]OBX72743.1 vibriobactin receptor [Haemophilus parainfluenzae]